MVSRQEALDRAEQDHGDADDVVWMKQTKKGRGRIYHDDPACSYLSTDSRVEFTRREAQHRGYGPCKVCSLETADISKTGTHPTDLIETVRQQMAKE